MLISCKKFCRRGRNPNLTVLLAARVIVGCSEQHPGACEKTSALIKLSIGNDCGSHITRGKENFYIFSAECRLERLGIPR